MAARYGLVGLAVMGENLALNIEQHGFPIAVYNRTAERTRRFAEGEAQGKQITPTYSIAEFVGALEHPRRIILMVQAGRAVDAVLACQMRAGQIIMVANEVGDRHPAFHVGLDTFSIERDRKFIQRKVSSTARDTIVACRCDS